MSAPPDRPAIEYKTGDILAEDVDALVNTVNCVGFMGRGIALQFSEAGLRPSSVARPASPNQKRCWLAPRSAGR